MMVPEGGSAKLICRARGFPKPRIVWRREDGAQIIVRTAPDKVERLNSVEGEVLTLTKVTRSEMGAYLCIAANGVPPTVSKRMMLHVHCEYSFLIFLSNILKRYQETETRCHIDETTSTERLENDSPPAISQITLVL
nr:unnamed protein product [Callosobruchus analis]